MVAVLGEFETPVLLALLRLGPSGYGMAVRREITERTGRDVAIGAGYATLERLDAKGMVASAAGDTTPARGGRARQFFLVTTSGRQAVAAAIVRAETTSTNDGTMRPE